MRPSPSYRPLPILPHHSAYREPVGQGGNQRIKDLNPLPVDLPRRPALLTARLVGSAGNTKSKSNLRLRAASAVGLERMKTGGLFVCPQCPPMVPNGDPHDSRGRIPRIPSSRHYFEAVVERNRSRQGPRVAPRRPPIRFRSCAPGHSAPAGLSVPFGDRPRRPILSPFGSRLRLRLRITSSSGRSFLFSSRQRAG